MYFSFLGVRSGSGDWEFEDGMFLSVKLGPHAKLVTVLNPEFPIGNGVSDDGGKNIQLKSTNNFIGTQPP